MRNVLNTVESNGRENAIVFNCPPLLFATFISYFDIPYFILEIRYINSERECIRIPFPIAYYHLRFLKRFVFSSVNHLLLQVFIHMIEVIAVTGHAHQQVFVILGTGLCGEQSSSIHNVELDMVSAQ